MTKQQYTSDNIQRLDAFLAEQSGLTRSKVQKLITDGNVLVDGVAVLKSSSMLKVGSVVDISIPEPVEQTKILPQDIDIEILYQDDDIAVINKPQGMIVHPAGNIYSDTLVNALLEKLDKLSGINGELRPGIVHRLDKETSGIMLIAKNDIAHNHLSVQFQNREIKKIYLGVTAGRMKQTSGTINAPIARHPKDRKKMSVMPTGKHATTKYKVIKDLQNTQLVEFDLLTGRTHQIRVHCKYLGHPIVGDNIYGSTALYKYQLLHSHIVEFVHPVSQERMRFVAELPPHFTKYIKKFS